MMICILLHCVRGSLYIISYIDYYTGELSKFVEHFSDNVITDLSTQLRDQSFQVCKL